MTREEAIRELKIFSGTTRIRLSANFWEALNTVIKALEQEPVLDKIRTEIAEYGSIWVEYSITDNSVSGIENLIEDVLEQAKEQVLQIIDKYQTQETHEKRTENARNIYNRSVKAESEE